MKTLPSVDQFLATLSHPFKTEILELRELILSVDPSISEAVKWNAPSFRTTEFFATIHLRAPNAFAVILHLGVKTRSIPPGSVEDPAGLLIWLGPDRAIVSFFSSEDLQAKAPAFTEIVRQWLTHVS